MKHKSSKLIKIVRRTLLAVVILLLVANLVQYFAEPTPPPQLENPKIELLTKEARPGDTFSYRITAIKNTNQDALNKRTLICEVGENQYTTIALQANPSSKSAPEGPIDAVFFLPLTPVEGDQIPPEVYNNYCYLRNSATYPKIHKQFTFFGLGDYRDADGVDDGFTTYVYDSYNCRDRSGSCDRSQMLKVLPPTDQPLSTVTPSSEIGQSPIALSPLQQTSPPRQEAQTSGGADPNQGGGNTPPPAVEQNTNPVLDLVRGVVSGATGLLDVVF